MTKLNIKLKERADETKHAQVSRQLAELIRAGKLATGTVLPGEKALAAQIGTSRKTVRSAYATLEADGLVGAATFTGRIVGGADKSGASRKGTSQKGTSHKGTDKSATKSSQAATTSAKQNLAAKRASVKGAKASGKK